MMDNTWEIMSIIDCFNERVSGLERFSKEREEFKELYAEAIRIQCKNEYGYVMTIDDFIKEVECCGFVDYDGSGVFLDKNGQRGSYVRCNANWLQQYRDGFAYVLWFNK